MFVAGCYSVKSVVRILLTKLLFETLTCHISTLGEKPHKFPCSVVDCLLWLNVISIKHLSSTDAMNIIGAFNILDQCAYSVACSGIASLLLSLVELSGNFLKDFPCFRGILICLTM